MITGEWACVCTALNDGGVRYCEACGAEHKREPSAPPPVTLPLPAYREVPAHQAPTGVHHPEPSSCTVPACHEPTCAAYVRSCVRTVARLAAAMSTRI